MRKCYFLTACIFLGMNVVAQDMRLIYEQPAQSWMDEALPIGNGYMGAMIYGGVVKDEVQISEESIWAGGPSKKTDYNFGNKTGSWRQLPVVRKLLEEGQIKQAETLVQQYFTGVTNPSPGSGEFGDYGSQQPFGSLFVMPLLSDSVYTGYERELNLNNALAKATYSRAGINFSQEYFASYPSRLIVASYQNDASNGVDYQISFASPHKLLKQTLKGNILTVQGRHAGNDLMISGQLLFKTDGKLKKNNDGYVIRNARNVEVYISVATDYKNEYPHYRGNDYKAVNKKAIMQAQNNTSAQLKEQHIADYTGLFNRVSLNLGTSSDAVTSLPTNKRLLRYSQGGYDPQLETLYYQYGRYLLISSSRPGTMPAHLQGKWNDKMAPPWACDYHMNINLQMIYWPSEITNLSECHEPLMEYIHSLRAPGQVTAKEYFNARGWCVNTMNNAYGYTAPGWDFNWGYAPNSAAWLCRHVWDHYQFTQDQNFLTTLAYPIMKEVGQFWLDYLTEDKEGTLVSAPSFSPEHGLVAIGATIDQEIAYDLFTNLIEAGKMLPGEQMFIDSIANARQRLAPLKIGKYGQLQEWKEDLDDPSNQHRHVSHLYAVYPGRQISPVHTPKLSEAAKRSLIYRGEEGTGWSLGWKINLWARFMDGNQSYKMIRNLLTPAIGDGSRPSGAGSYRNLLCAHPPFQIDGNMGAVTGMTEMLLQSQDGTLNLLPALPVAWPQGKVEGLKAVGGYTVGIEWKDGFLQTVTIESSKGGDCQIAYKNAGMTITMKPGEKVTLSGDKFLSMF